MSFDRMWVGLLRVRELKSDQTSVERRKRGTEHFFLPSIFTFTKIQWEDATRKEEGEEIEKKKKKKKHHQHSMCKT